jgi:hypothetical protein
MKTSGQQRTAQEPRVGKPDPRVAEVALERVRTRREPRALAWQVVVRVQERLQQWPAAVVLAVQADAALHGAVELLHKLRGLRCVVDAVHMRLQHAPAISEQDISTSVQSDMVQQ